MAAADSRVREARATERTVAAVHPPVAATSDFAASGARLSPKPERPTSDASCQLRARSAALKWKYSARRSRSAPGGNLRANTISRWSPER